MYSINNINSYNTNPLKSAVTVISGKPPAKTLGVVIPTAKNPISFSAAETAGIRTEIVNKEEKEKYSAVSNALPKAERKTLEILLKTGKLLNSNSNDKSTTLDNLYKIITEPRAQGLDAAVVLKETVNTIADPFVITQNFGDIPKEYVPKILEIGKNNTLPTNLIQRAMNIQNTKDPINEQTINVEHSGACVSASIEFNLAKQMPAEFARFAQSLSSPKLSVEKTIHLDKLANTPLDAIWLLNAFEVPYEANDFKTAKLTLAPDKSAITRAQIQNSHKDPLERSLVDVLMQSTFMNVGSQQSYDSLTDVRAGKFNQNDKGLIEFEKTFTESVVEDKNKISVTYQTVDENAKLTGYETDFATIKKHILETLNMGENVIIGYTQTDENNVIINGHEITIIGTKQGKDGKLIFVCNDTDDNYPKQIEYSEDYLIPKIHHAGLPQEVAEKDMQFVDNWKEGLNAYKEMKTQNLGTQIHSA